MNLRVERRDKLKNATYRDEHIYNYESIYLEFISPHVDAIPINQRFYFNTCLMRIYFDT